jgi:hypothetical protein
MFSLDALLTHNHRTNPVSAMEHVKSAEIRGENANIAASTAGKMRQAATQKSEQIQQLVSNYVGCEGLIITNLKVIFN